MNLIYGDQLNYLNLHNSVAEQIEHDENYIKTGDGKTGVRRIFGGGVPYSDFEGQSLVDLKNQMANSDLDEYNHFKYISVFPDETLLRFLYSMQFDKTKVIQALNAHKKWLDDPNNFDETRAAMSLITSGIIYILGRDIQQRPAIFINAFELNQKEIRLQDFLVAMNIVLTVAQDYMFYPGRVENWHILIESNDMGLFSFPHQILRSIASMASQHFPGCLEKIWILNPSTSLKYSWGLMEKFIDDSCNKKIVLLQPQDFSKLTEYFYASDIPQEYKGYRPVPTQFWPPLRDQNQQYGGDIIVTDALGNSKIILEGSHPLAQSNSNFQTIEVKRSRYLQNLAPDVVEPQLGFSNRYSNRPTEKQSPVLSQARLVESKNLKPAQEVPLMINLNKYKGNYPKPYEPQFKPPEVEQEFVYVPRISYQKDKQNQQKGFIYQSQLNQLVSLQETSHQYRQDEASRYSSPQPQQNFDVVQVMVKCYKKLKTNSQPLRQSKPSSDFEKRRTMESQPVRSVGSSNKLYESRKQLNTQDDYKACSIM